jgi:DNA excision repair protein ERCC-2
MDKPHQIPIRDLVAFCFQTGDIGGESPGSVDPEEAIRLHQRIQRSRPKPYDSEVTVSRAFSNRGLALTLAAGSTACSRRAALQ